MMGTRVTQEKASRTIFMCPGASKAVGKEEEKESNASRTLNANPGEKQARERRGFQRLLCFQLSPAESVGSRRKGSWVLSALWPEITLFRCSEGAIGQGVRNS